MTIDTCRRDFLGCYGGIDTPALDRLAEEGVLFERAVAQAPLTLPSHASIFTGLRPTAHGIRDNGRFTLEDRFETWAEIMAAHGYSTGAAIGAFPVAGRFGLAQGFDFYDDDLTAGSGGGLIFRERNAEAVNAAALGWLHQRDEKPFFLWVHYFDPHRPYQPPSPWREGYADNLYAGEVAYTDAQLGKLLLELDTLGYSENTLVVVVGDHGEGLGDHGEPSHGLFLYDATVMVPCLLKPCRGLDYEVKAGYRLPEIVETVDLLPTVLDLVGISSTTTRHGKSVARYLDGSGLPSGESDGEVRYAYSETFFPYLSYGWSELRSLRSREWKYIEAPEPELYQVSQDPQELRNLAHARPELAEEMRERLEQSAANESASRPSAMDAETMARLRSLGYLGQSGSQGSESAPDTGGLLRAPEGSPDPKNMVEVFSSLLAAGEYMSHREFKKAASLLRHAVTLDPDNEPARLFLAEALRRMDRPEDALREFRAVLERNPSSAEALLGVAVVDFARGDWDQAESEVCEALRLRPDWGEARYNLALIREAQGRMDDARREIELAVEGSPYFIEGWVKLGNLLYEEKKWAEASRAWGRALTLEPTHPVAAMGVEELRKEFGEDSLRVWQRSGD